MEIRRMTPIALTDAQLAAIQDLARLIPSWRRDEFLRELATRLRDVELGDGSVHWISDDINTTGPDGACCGVWDRLIASRDGQPVELE